MKIVNKTHWRTADLRRIIARVACEELNDTYQQRWQRKHLRVTVVYSRGAHSGCAWVRGTAARLRVPSSAVDPVEFAWLCAHEFSHTRGMKHRRMPKWLMYFTEESRARYAWAAEYPTSRAPIVAPEPITDDTKYTHVVKMLRFAETRRKRAVTIERKWRQKARYYERKMAASRGAAPTDSEGSPSAKETT